MSNHKSNVIDMTNFHIGRLTVIGRCENIGNQAAWLCICECGNTTKIQGYELRKGNRTSCGKCTSIGDKMRKHGMYQSRLYCIWDNMKARCYRKSTRAYKDYGGRGIVVCSEWKNNFIVFYEWAMANGYENNLTIERIDVNGNYEPNNCKWILQGEQLNNTRKNILLTKNGETHNIAQWSKITHIPYETIRARIRYGWTDVEKILSNTNFAKETKK